MAKEIEPQTLFLEEDRQMPNHPDLPVLVYPRAVEPEQAQQAFERRFAENGWRGIWLNGILGYHHFHPDAHEVLGVARGHVEVQLGGESGRPLTLSAGDMVVLPAGTGHKNLSASSDFLVVGAYPEGQEDYTICREKVARQKMAGVPRPETDPFYGKDGPLTRLWR